MEDILSLVVVHTFHDFRSHKRAFRDNAFQRHHTVEVDGAQSPRIASEFAKATDEGTVVHLSIVKP